MDPYTVSHSAAERIHPAMQAMHNDHGAKELRELFQLSTNLSKYSAQLYLCIVHWPYISLWKWKGQAGKSPTTSLGFNIHRDIRTERSWWKCVRDRFALVTMALYYREMDRVQDDCCHGSWGKYFVGVVNHFAPAIFTVFQLWWGMRYGIVRSHRFGLGWNGTGRFRHGLQEDTIRQVGS